MLNFIEWLKKVKEASIPYDPNLDISGSAGGWWGAPGSGVKHKKRKKKKKKS
jgi:hypothetical protein